MSEFQGDNKSDKNDIVNEEKIIENFEEFQYLNIIKRLISDYEAGRKKIRMDRTKVGTIATFVETCRYSLRDGLLPLLTTKRVFWKGVVEELLWFIKGSTNSNVLSEKGVAIWDENGSKEFLTTQGLGHREKGDLGPVYGFQWRHAGADYKTMKDNYEGQGIDQLSKVIQDIKNNSTSRRLIVSAWNVADLSKMALPPCHLLFQFFVEEDQLSCCMYQRSADIGLGVPFNIASYALLTHMVASVCKLKPAEFVHIMADCHIYSNHIEPLKTQLERNPRPFPKLKINREVENLEDFNGNDFELINYKPYPTIKMKMAV